MITRPEIKTSSNIRRKNTATSGQKYANISNSVATTNGKILTKACTISESSGRNGISLEKLKIDNISCCSDKEKRKLRTAKTIKGYR